MPDDDKVYYREKAKGGEVKIPKPRSANSSSNSSKPTGLFTTQGVPVALYDEQQRREKEELENMRKRIGKMVQELPLMTGTLTKNKNDSIKLNFFFRAMKCASAIAQFVFIFYFLCRFLNLPHLFDVRKFLLQEQRWYS